MVGLNRPGTQEFVTGLSVLARGSVQEKLLWAFNLYDLNGDGVVTKDEMTEIVSSVYDLIGSCAEPPMDDVTAREHVDRIFKKMDAGNNGVITADEFMQVCEMDDIICKSLGVFDTVL